MTWGKEFDVGEKVRLKTLRCPKCRKRNSLKAIVEKSVCYQSWDVSDNQIIHDEGWKSHGGILSVWAVCHCGHEWTPRRATQITDLVEKDE